MLRGAASLRARWPAGQVALLDRSGATGRSDGIDVLRFALVMYVIIAHLALWGPLSSTGAGPLRAFGHLTESLFQGHGETNPAVVGFIVLSGYCIHRNGARRGRWSGRSYGIRRAFRILPVYVLAGMFGAALLSSSIATNPTIARTASGTTSITAGGLLVKLTALIALLPSPQTYALSYQGNAPLATVAAEMWLYVFYGGAMWLLLRGRIAERTLWWAISVITAVSFLAVAAYPTLEPWWFNGSVVGFLPLWWIGAWFVGDRSRRQLLWAAIAAAVAWVLCSLLLRSVGNLPLEEIRLLCLGGFAAVVISLIDRTRAQWPSALARLGRSGYSLYAFHAPILILLIAIGIPWPIVVVVPTVVGVVIFRLVEDPLTELGRRAAVSLRDSRLLGSSPAFAEFSNED